MIADVAVEDIVTLFLLFFSWHAPSAKAKWFLIKTIFKKL